MTDGVTGTTIIHGSGGPLVCRVVRRTGRLWRMVNRVDVQGRQILRGSWLWWRGGREAERPISALTFAVFSMKQWSVLPPTREAANFQSLPVEITSFSSENGWICSMWKSLGCNVFEGRESPAFPSHFFIRLQRLYWRCGECDQTLGSRAKSEHPVTLVFSKARNVRFVPALSAYGTVKAWRSTAMLFSSGNVGLISGRRR